MVPMPPACPEFNAAENIWHLQYLRQNYLSNRVFDAARLGQVARDDDLLRELLPAQAFGPHCSP
jgi:hypothetical protein